MSGPVNPTTDPVALEVAGIEDALDALLTTIVEADVREAKDRSREPFRIESMREVLANLDKSRAAQAAESLIRSPVGYACRMGVRSLGERLYEIGGMDLMTRVLDDVAEREPSKSGYRMGVMDARWDGIGRSGGNPGWCS